MIQVLTYSGKETNLKGKDVVINSIHSPQSLDEFNTNVVILKDKEIWKNPREHTQGCHIMDDFLSLAIMIKNKKSTHVLIVYPQNEDYLYDFWDFKKVYQKKCELKNMLSNMVKHIIGKIYTPLEGINVMYENTKTKVGRFELPAAFNFIGGETILLSNQSNKKTVVKVNDIYASTLQINCYDELIDLLKEINLINDKQDIPEWIDEVSMFDDEAQKETITVNQSIIEGANEKILIANDILDKNRYYKSILYTNGDELVAVTFEILQQILGCDLSTFVDKKKEDFLFSIENHVFIGEIKGVNHNVKNENVSQLDVHYQSYIDENPEIKDEDISAILIMNHQKNKRLNEREEVHENQIKLAKRNGSLIVETITLLKMYEKYLNNEMTREQCIDVLKRGKGLLVL